MTAEEIKKALMKCSVDSCKDCPYDNTGLYCCANLKRDALAHITEQEKEIERLKNRIVAKRPATERKRRRGFKEEER